MEKTNDKLPEEIVKAIKAEANEIYWQTHKISKERDPYCMGLTMFEVAQVPLIEALTVRQVKHDELQAQVNELDAIVNLFDKLGDCVLVRDSVETYKRKKALQQFKDGKGKEIENKEVNPLVLLHNPQK